MHLDDRGTTTGPARIWRNAWEPLSIPRWAVSLKYLLFIAAGIVGFFTRVAALDLQTFYGYEPIWASMLTIGGLLAFFGSLSSSPRRELVEGIGATIIAAFLLVFVVSVIGRESYAGAVLLSIVTVLPATRGIYLLYKWGRDYSGGRNNKRVL